MDKTQHNEDSWVMRVYQWPISYFAGLFIGAAVTGGSVYWDRTLFSKFEDSGAWLFFIGWTLMIGSVFGSGTAKIFGTPPASKLERGVRRASLLIGLVLSTTAFVGFTKATETLGEPGAAGQPATRPESK